MRQFVTLEKSTFQIEWRPLKTIQKYRQHKVFIMQRIFTALVLAASGMLLSGCGGDSSSTDTGSVEISIPFKAVAGDQKIKCGTDITGLGNGAGSAGNTAKIANFRMYVHNINLVTDQGIKIPVTLDGNEAGQNSDVALLDFRDTAEGTTVCPENSTVETSENPNYNDTIKGTAVIDSAYTLSNIEFTLGVPFDLNHENQSSAEEPLRHPGLASGMAWSWQNGYKFVGFDVLPDGDVTKWNIHLGSTGCTTGVSDLSNGVDPEECTAANRPTVTLPIGTTEIDNLVIKIDYASLVQDNNLAENEGGAPGCMSGSTDPECEEIFEKFGLSWGDNDAVTQTVFSVIDSSDL